MKTISLWFVGTIIGLAICFVMAQRTLDNPKRRIGYGDLAVRSISENLGVGSFKKIFSFSNDSKDRAAIQAAAHPFRQKNSLPEDASNELAVAASGPKLPFSPEVLAILEESFDDLPLQAEMTQELTGWRFRRVNANSIFARAGFKSGDYISSESIDNALAEFNSSNHELAKRTYKILQKVTY